MPLISGAGSFGAKETAQTWVIQFIRALALTAWSGETSTWLLMEMPGMGHGGNLIQCKTLCIAPLCLLSKTASTALLLCKLLLFLTIDVMLGVGGCLCEMHFRLCESIARVRARCPAWLAEEEELLSMMLHRTHPGCSSSQ